MIADWIDAELRNWARWCHSGPWPHPIPPDHAASLEGRYIAPIIEDVDWNGRHGSDRTGYVRRRTDRQATKGSVLID